MQVQPYVFFNGRCEEAVEFYRRAIGAEVTALIKYKDSPEPPKPGMLPPGSENKVMHGAIRVGDTTVLVSDGRCAGPTSFEGFSLALSASTTAEAEKLFAALSEGGQVLQPLITTFFSPRFGIVADRFGMSWMVLVEVPS